MPDLVKPIPCADGERRAEPIAFGLYSPDATTALSTGLHALAGSVTLRQADQGRAFSNSAAATVTLPTPSFGHRFTFVKRHNSAFAVVAAAGTTINGNASYTNSENEVVTAWLELTAITPTQWLVTGTGGTWVTA